MIAALVCALDDEFFALEDVADRVLEDAQTGGDDNDAASFLAASLARQATETGEDASPARRAFWVWWLSDAVPQAVARGPVESGLA